MPLDFTREIVYVRFMNRTFRSIFVAGYILLHLCTAFVLDTGHTDIFEYVGGGVQTLTTHDCGSHERHKDIPKDHFCPACYRAANGAATISTILPPSSSCPEIAATLVVVTERAPHTDYFSSASKRGPPSLLS